MDLTRSVYSRDLKIAAMRVLDAGSATGETMPVIVEGDVLVGGNCGIYKGTIVKRSAVLGTSTILNRFTPVYDLVRNTVHRATGDDPLIVPEVAVVIAGTSGLGKE
jgi:hypothetical protein